MVYTRVYCILICEGKGRVVPVRPLEWR